MSYSTDTSLLMKGLYWVIFRFPDSSLKLIRTSLSAEIVGEDHIKKGHIYDVLTHRFISLERLQGTSIEIYTERPVISEVDEFANSYFL